MSHKSKHTQRLFDLLEENYLRFNQFHFIEDDPISIPHQFKQKQDIEISAFLSAIIAWGQRKTIIRNAKKMMELMDQSPFDFIVNHREKELAPFRTFVHRTFNGDDLIYFIHALRMIYSQHPSMENSFLNGSDMKERISNFKRAFFQDEHLKRTEKHLADPLKSSSAKRLNMFLRWMVRKDNKGVDFGIWDQITSAELMLPLDIHTATVGRKLKLLKRKQNDWKAVEEITKSLRLFDPKDPVKYDYALFGMGVNSIV
jgi:uncharacterized protein (TIGR02757 family)